MKTALVIGGAACVWTDLEAYTGPVDGVVACNDVGVDYKGELAAWVSLHPEKFGRWVEQRGNRPVLVSFRQPTPPGRFPAMDIVTPNTFPGQERCGSSGQFAAKVALCDLGFDRVVLAGVPMTATPHYNREKPWRNAADFARCWHDIPTHYRARMRSMSGWSREFLGAP